MVHEELMKNGDKLKFFVFYKEKVEPDVFKWEFINYRHFWKVVHGYFVMVDNKFNTPFLVVYYSQGKYMGFATTEKRYRARKREEAENSKHHS